MQLKKKQYKKIIKRVLDYCHDERAIIEQSLTPEMSASRYSEAYASMRTYDIIIKLIDNEINKAKEDVLS